MNTPKHDAISDHGNTLLVVDDEPELLEILAAGLVSQGYTVLTAPNGKEAYQMVVHNPVDLVLTDIRMRDGDGIELLKEIRRRNPSKPAVILMTAFADITPDAAIDQGAAALLPKPFLMSDLRKLIAGILRH